MITSKSHLIAFEIKSLKEQTGHQNMIWQQATLYAKKLGWEFLILKVGYN